MRLNAMRRWRLAVLVSCAALVAACNDRPIVNTTPLPPGATIVIRPTPPPPAPSRETGFALGKYALANALTAKGPRTAPEHAMETPAQRRALDLAKALGFGDASVAFGGNPWTIERGQEFLRIWPESGGRWEYDRGSNDQNFPEDRQALKLARPILRAAGLDPAEARVDQNQVIVEPLLRQHPTWGWETKILFDGKGLAAASGWLGPAKKGPERPLLDATQAFTKLQQQAAQPPSSGELCPAIYQLRTPPCMKPVNASVTGARFVYAIDWRVEGHHPKLVPAWLFTLQGTDEPRAYPA